MTAINHRPRGRRFGRLIITTCRQAGGHPWFDQAGTTDDDGNVYRSVAIRPSLRRRKYDRPGGRALVVGWRENGSRCTGDPCTCTNGIGCVNVPVDQW